ncbi:MAG: PIG-L family deacetylase [Verrucomicrobia bacterium]|nr:PIG-L family deacetylase [Verrucomicrobiota bacterium]
MDFRVVSRRASGLDAVMRGLCWKLFLGVFGLVVGIFAQTSEPPQGAALLKVDLMGVFAHPDDETGAAGTLAAYALGRGKVVANVYCTRGEGGGNMVGTQSGRALGVLREAELRDCLHLLGVRYCYFLDQADFAYTESLAITLEKWGHEETLRRLVRLVRALRPEVMVTMNPAPNPGQHGNHQAAGLLAIEAFDAAADPSRFPEQLKDEGLSPWQVRKLYYGGPAGTGATIEVNQPLADGRSPGQIAGVALSQHRSQGFGGFVNSPWLRRPQNWTLVKSVVPFATDEVDLFRGLPVEDSVKPVNAPAVADTVAESGVRFVARPAVEFYQAWVQEQGIRHVAQAFAPDVPVVAGETNVVYLDLPTAASVPGVSEWTVPEGWKVEVGSAAVSGATTGFQRWPIRVIPPVGRPADAELSVRVAALVPPVNAAVRLHPVPRLTASRVTPPLELTRQDEDPRWKALQVHSIRPQDTWQGTVTNAADSSAEFRLAVDDSTLWVEVRVHDDVVVSNIAPNDIKGHWRSDSVELCLDPNPGSGHTLGCYKVGIFPFDSAGHVRGARDADARPGLVEETAPGTRLISWKTADGYALRVAIPRSELGATGARLGFNVLVYDGDKADAAPGENINRSRLAWAPRSGVQGRPEDWGRLDLP